MARGIKLQNVKDFRGGLNLRGDGFELSENESPDLLNVDIDARGGIQSRPGIKLEDIAWGNPNLLNPNQATAKDTLDETGVIRNNNTGSRFVGAAGSGPSALNGRPTVDTWDRATVTAAGTASKNRSVTVTPTTRYSIGVYMKSVSGSLHEIALQLDWYDSSSTLISSTSSAKLNLTNGWQFLSLQGVAAPANASFVNCIAWIAHTAATASSVVDVAGWHIAQGYNANYFDQTILQLPGEITTWGRFVRQGLNDQLYACAGSVMVYCNTSAPNTWFVLENWTSTAWFVQFKDLFYYGEQNQFTRVFDSYTLLKLTDGYNDNLAAPSGNFSAAAKFPVMSRSHPAVFQGVVFVAVGQDLSPTVHKNRLRWSHPNNANDWRSFDYIDIDVGVDGDVITALVPFGDRLLIFKRHSIYALSGTSPDTFQVYPISRRVGATDARALVLTEAGVYFYDEREGVFVFDGKGIRWQFERIHPLITNGLIAQAEVGRVRLGWSGRRLWVAVPWRATREEAAPATNTRVFVLDPRLTKEGSWTQYDCVVGSMYELVVVGQAVRLIGARPYLGRWYTLEDPSVAPLATDRVSDGVTVTNIHITSHYVTPWYDTGQPSIAKRWRKPEFVLRSINADSSIEVELRRDFDSRLTKRRFSLNTDPDSAEMLWGDNWGEIWAGASTTSPASVILSGPTLGKAKSIQLKVNGPATNHHWGLNALTLKYSPLPPRS